MVKKQLVNYSANTKQTPEDHFDNFIMNAFVSITMYNQCFGVAFLLLHVTVRM